MRKTFLTTFILTLFGAVPVLYAQVWDANFYVERGSQYMMQNDLARALEMYNSVLIREPENIKALNGRGNVYMKRGEYLKAKADFQYAYSLNPEIAESRHNLETANERLKLGSSFSPITEQAGMTGDEYRDAARYLGTTDYTVNTRITGGTGIGAASGSQMQYGNTNTNYNFNYQQPTPPNEPTPLYDRNIAEQMPPQTLYERSASEEASKLSLYDRNITEEARAQQMTNQYTQQYGPPKASAIYPPVQPQPQTRTGTSYLSPQQGYAYPSQQGYAYTQPQTAYTQTQSVRVTSERLPQAAVPLIPARPFEMGVIPSTGSRSLRVDTITPSARSFPQPALDVQTRSYYERAVLAYSDIITRNPNFAIAYNNRGVAYAKLGDLAKALSDFNQALRINPYYYDAQANREQVRYWY